MSRRPVTNSLAHPSGVLLAARACHPSSMAGAGSCSLSAWRIMTSLLGDANPFSKPLSYCCWTGVSCGTVVAGATACQPPLGRDDAVVGGVVVGAVGFLTLLLAAACRPPVKRAATPPAMTSTPSTSPIPARILRCLIGAFPPKRRS